MKGKIKNETEVGMNKMINFHLEHGEQRNPGQLLIRTP